MYESLNFTHATDSLMACPCCGTGNLSIATLLILEDVRRHFNAPVTITSGARCAVHNKKVGGARRSTHLVTPDDQDAEGVDFKVEGVSTTQVAKYLKNCPYANLIGIGKYSTWVHVDPRGYGARW